MSTVKQNSQRTVACSYWNTAQQTINLNGTNNTPPKDYQSYLEKVNMLIGQIAFPARLLKLTIQPAIVGKATKYTNQ